MKTPVYTNSPGWTHAEFVAAVALAVATDTPLRLGVGTFELDSPVTIPSGLHLIGAGDGRTVIRKSAAWSGSGVDSRTNAFFHYTPVLHETTTLTAVAPERARAVAVTSEGAFNPGDWFYVRGSNIQAEDAFGMSDGTSVFLQELCRVDSTETGLLHTRWPLRQQHGITTNVVQKIGAALTDVIFEGITLDGQGGVACGISVDSSYGLILRDIGFAGFTRTGLDIVGDFATDVGTVHNLGGNNCLVISKSSIDGEFGDGKWTFDPEGDRFAATGTIRGQVHFSCRATNCTINPGRLGRGCFSLVLCGGLHVDVPHYFSIDMDPTEVYGRTLAEGFTTIIGTAWHGGFDPIPYAEFGFDIRSGGFTAVDHVHPRTAITGSVYPGGGPMSAYVHDQKIQLYGIVSIYNFGAGPDYTLDGSDHYDLIGMMLKDAYLDGGRISMRGVRHAIMTENVYAVCTSDLDFIGTPGLGANTSIVFSLSHGEAGGLRFKRISLGNTSLVFDMGPGFASAANNREHEIIADEFNINGRIFRGPIMLARTSVGASFGIGDIAEIDPTSSLEVRKIREYTGTGMPVVVCGGYPDPSENTVVPYLALPAELASVNTYGLVRHGSTMVGAPGETTAREGSTGQALGRAVAGGGGYMAPGTSVTLTEVGVTGDTITRATGSWIADGFVAGHTIVVSGTSTNDGAFTIASLTATVITLGSDDLTTEGPTDTVTVTSTGVALQIGPATPVASAVGERVLAADGITSDDVYSDLVDAFADSLIPVAEGETLHIEARTIFRVTSTALLGGAVSVAGRTVKAEATVSNVNGTVTVDEGSAAQTGAAAGGNTPTVLFTVVAGDGVKIQAKIDPPAEPTYTADANVKAYVRTHVCTSDDPVIAEYAMPGENHLWRDEYVLNAGDIEEIVDLVGSDNMIVRNVTDTADAVMLTTTIGGQPGWSMGSAGNERIAIATFAAAEAYTSGAIFVLIEQETLNGPNFQPFIWGSTTAPTTNGPGVGTFNFNVSAQRGGGLGDINVVAPYASGSEIVSAVLLTWDGSDAELWWNGDLLGSDITDVVVANVKRWVLGQLASMSGGYHPTGMKMGEVRTGTSHITGADVTALFAYANGRYGTPT